MTPYSSKARHDDTYDDAALLDLDLSAGHRNTWDDPPLTVPCRISSHLRRVRSMMERDDEGDTRRVYLEGGLDSNDLATDCSVGGDGDDPTCTRLTTGRARRPSGGVVAPRRPLGAIPPLGGENKHMSSASPFPNDLTLLTACGN